MYYRVLLHHYSALQTPVGDYNSCTCTPVGDYNSSTPQGDVIADDLKPHFRRRCDAHATESRLVAVQLSSGEEYSRHPFQRNLEHPSS